MPQDLSGFGTVINLVASVTFPVGFNISQFADDADPFDIPGIPVKEGAMGLNGDLITWSKATPLKATVNVIEGSDDDTNLSIVFEANRVSRGKASVGDVIQLSVVYPSGRTLTLANGVMTQGQPGPSIASAGRLKTKQYQFMFESKSDKF